ncbi:MAG: glycosyltransferase family 2 protein [Acutalibacteraceae bacterium]
MPKISVIIPAYNSEKFIAETLDSLLCQTLKDIEIVIVNDGSTDGTQKIIDGYTEKYPFIKSFTQQNAGVSAARNNGLEKATGEYVVFLDADDYFSPGSLEAFYETAKETGADIVIGRLCPFNEERIGKFNAFADKLAQMKSIDTFDITLLWNFLVSNKCYERKRLVESGVRFPPFRYSEEGAFFMRYVYTGATISGTMKSEMYYRRHSAAQGLSVSQTVSTDLAKSFSSSLEMIYRDAKKAVSESDKDFDKEEYLQEVIYKDAYVLLSQFYRLMWHGDDECVRYCAEEFLRLSALMTPKRLEVFKQTDKDLHTQNLFASKEEVAAKPNISVIVGKCKNKDMTAFFHSLYDQTSPMFEVIVPKSLAQSGRIPKEYLEMKNLVVLDDKNFMKKAKKAAKGKKIIFSRPVLLDLRTFRLFYKIPLPEKLKAIFFAPLTKLLNFMLVKRILK